MIPAGGSDQVRPPVRVGCPAESTNTPMLSCGETIAVVLYIGVTICFDLSSKELCLSVEVRGSNVSSAYSSWEGKSLEKCGQFYAALIT